MESLHLSSQRLKSEYVLQTLSQSQFDAALAAADDVDASPEERAEMLMEIAMGMQQRPKSAKQLHDAVALYERAQGLVPATAPLLRARITARMGTALQALPDGGAQRLERAQQCFSTAIKPLWCAATSAIVTKLSPFCERSRPTLQSWQRLE